MVAAATTTTTMGEKTDSKLDTQSLDSVSVPTNYSVTSEPPPYKWPTGKSVKIARLVAVTVIAVAALLGGAIVLAAYIQSSRGTHCTLTEPRKFEAPQPTTASLAAAEVRDILKEKETPKEEKEVTEALKTVQVEKVEEKAKKEEAIKEKEEEAAQKEKENEEEEEEDDVEIDLGKLLKLPFDINKLARMFMDINQKDNTNCFVEKVDLNDSNGRKPSRIMDIGGVSVAVICESVSNPKPSFPFPFGMAIGRPMMLQNPLGLRLNSPPPFGVHPAQRMGLESVFGPRAPARPLPFFNQPAPPRHLVPPARRLDTEQPIPSRNLVQEPRPQQQIPVARGMPFLPRPLPQRPAPEVNQQPAVSIPVSPLTVPAVRGNPDLADQPKQPDTSVQEGLPKPRGRSLNFDGPVVPFAEEKADKPAAPFMNFLRSIIAPHGSAFPQPQQRSFSPAQAIPIPVPIQARADGSPRPMGRQLHLQPVITLPQFLQAPPARSHTIQPRSVN